LEGIESNFKLTPSTQIKLTPDADLMKSHAPHHVIRAPSDVDVAAQCNSGIDNIQDALGA
jgi:hypothetical protein